MFLSASEERSEIKIYNREIGKEDFLEQTNTLLKNPQLMQLLIKHIGGFWK